VSDKTQSKKSAPGLLDDLAKRPGAFGLFAALRAIQAAHRDKPRIGTSEWIADDPVRLKQEPTMGFEPAELKHYGSDGGPAELVSVAFGLFGPDGPLPHHVTERVIDAAMRQRHHHLRDFADIFHHRLISLLYRAWEHGQIAVSRDRPNEEDVYARFLLSLVGAGAQGFRDRDALPDDVRCYLAGRLSARPVTANTLSALLSVLTGVEVRIVEFVGEWLRVAPDQQSAIGRAGAALGVDTLVGARQFSLQTRVRARIGPLNLAQYRALLPNGPQFRKIRDALHTAVGLAVGWELQPVLAQAEIPALALDGSCALGWDSWLCEDVRFADADDLRLGIDNNLM